MRALICVLTLLVSLFFLQVTFASNDYTIPLLVGGLSGGLAVTQAVMLRSERAGLRRWLWTGVAAIAGLNVLMNVPRYVWTLGHLVGGQ